MAPPPALIRVVSGAHPMVAAARVAEHRDMTSQTPAEGGLPPTGTTPPPATGFFNQLRGIGLYRSDERWVGGVAGGIAARFGLDPLLVRGIFLATLLLGGFGLVLYALAWALLPEERDGRIHMEGLTLGHPDVALFGALLMFIAGLSRVAWWPFGMPGWIQGLFWLGATILVIVLVATMLQHRRPPAPRPAPVPYAGGSYGPAPQAGPYAGQPRPYTGPAPYAAPGAYGAPPSGGPGPRPGGAPYGPGLASSQASSYGSSYGGPAPAPGSGPTTPAAAAGTAARTSAPVPPPPTWSAPPAPAPVPYRAAPAPAPVRPPAPPRPRRRGPGATLVGISVALSLFVIAGLLIAQRAGYTDRTTAGTAAALIVIIFGVAIIVAGLMGRRSGVLTLLAILTAVVAFPIAVTTRDGLNPWIVDRNGVHVETTQGTTTFTDRATAANGYRMGFGNATLDLTQVPLQAGNQLTVPIDVSAGNLVVVVPQGSATGAQIDLGAGQVTWRVGGDDTSVNGVGRHGNLGVPAGQADLLLQIHVGAGNVTVLEGSR